ncbi:MAG: divergent polysaccharide deacetylase family protein [bacterium]|nr:divergent polysaccharide deacetylase family protein [bacterium]
MGSAATADPELMSALADELAARGMYFLDSLTTPRSVAAARMRAAGVPTLVNRIFLDQSVTNREQVRELLARLVKSARARGAAVGICHPYPETLAVLSEELPRLRDEGLRMVTVSELLALEAARRTAAETLP